MQTKILEAYGLKLNAEESANKYTFKTSKFFSALVFLALNFVSCSFYWGKPSPLQKEEQAKNNPTYFPKDVVITPTPTTMSLSFNIDSLTTEKVRVEFLRAQDRVCAWSTEANTSFASGGGRICTLTNIDIKNFKINNWAQDFIVRFTPLNEAGIEIGSSEVNELTPGSALPIRFVNPNFTTATASLTDPNYPGYCTSNNYAAETEQLNNLDSMVINRIVYYIQELQGTTGSTTAIVGASPATYNVSLAGLPAATLAGMQAAPNTTYTFVKEIYSNNPLLSPIVISTPVNFINTQQVYITAAGTGVNVWTADAGIEEAKRRMALGTPPAKVDIFVENGTVDVNNSHDLSGIANINIFGNTAGATRFNFNNPVILNLNGSRLSDVGFQLNTNGVIFRNALLDTNAANDFQVNGIGGNRTFTFDNVRCVAANLSAVNPVSKLNVSCGNVNPIITNINISGTSPNYDISSWGFSGLDSLSMNNVTFNTGADKILVSTSNTFYKKFVFHNPAANISATIQNCTFNSGITSAANDVFLNFISFENTAPLVLTNSINIQNNIFTISSVTTGNITIPAYASKAISIYNIAGTPATPLIIDNNIFNLGVTLSAAGKYAAIMETAPIPGNANVNVLRNNTFNGNNSFTLNSILTFYYDSLTAAFTNDVNNPAATTDAGGVNTPANTINNP